MLGLFSMTAGHAAEPENADLEALRVRVVEALTEEIQKADPDEGRTVSLLEFARERVREADPTRITTAELTRLAPDGRVPPDISEQTRSLLTEFAREVSAAHQCLQQDASSRYVDQASALLRRAMATRDPGKATELTRQTADLADVWSQITNTRGISALRPDSLRSTLDLFAVLHRFREAEDWQSFGSRLQQITRKLAEFPAIPEARKIQEFENSMLALADLPPVNQLESNYPAMLDALLDDSRQAELPERAASIRRHAQVFGTITSSGPYQPVAQRWQGLAQFAEDFQQQVAQAREGKTPTLRAERWTSASNASMRLPLEPEELEAKWRDYEVVIDESGKTRALLPDLDELLSQVGSLAEIEDALEDIEYAERILASSVGTQSMLTQRLRLLAEIHAALESGERTVLRNDLVALLNHSSMNWAYARAGLGGGAPYLVPHGEALDRLLDQARRRVAERILSAADLAADAELQPALRQRFTRARENGDWEDLLAVDRLAGLYFTQGGWLSEAERQAVGHFLAARRQSAAFDQTRLAVFHLQLAISAATELPGDALLRKQLDEIRVSAPKAYDRGTSDALAGKLGDQLPPDTAWILPRTIR